MNRGIIDVPRFLIMATAVDWDIDWRGQSAGSDTAGGEQIVYNRFPRWTGTPSVILPEPLIGIWRALRARAQGRVNAWRLPMIDPVSAVGQCGGWQSDLHAWRAGLYQEYAPTVTCTVAASAGATTITVDERVAPEPVRIGAYLSYNDWPFIVTGRTGAGAATVLSVEMLRTGVPAGGKVDLLAKGVFLASSDGMGNPAYDVNRVASFDLDLIEWINR